jgi:hypothetical protein
MSLGVGPVRVYGSRSPRSQARRNLAIRAHERRLIEQNRVRSAHQAQRRTRALQLLASDTPGFDKFLQLAGMYFTQVIVFGFVALLLVAAIIPTL